MRILLDTHILLWALTEPDRLTPKVQSDLTDTGHEILFSVASIWEIAIKAGLRRPDFAVGPDRIVTAAQQTGFTELPVHTAAALRVATLPHHHRDPFDRLLVAQALTESANFYTADAKLAQYSDLVVCI